jgi:hypothetical protein
MAMWAMSRASASDPSAAYSANVPPVAAMRDCASHDPTSYLVTLSDGRRVKVSDLTLAQATEEVCRLMKLAESVSALSTEIRSLVDNYHAAH